MHLKIDNEWALASDEHCWIIQRYEQPTDSYPEGRWRNKAFLTSFESAINSLAKRLIRLSDATTFIEAIKDAQEVKSHLTEVFDRNIKEVNIEQCKLNMTLPRH